MYKMVENMYKKSFKNCICDFHIYIYILYTLNVPYLAFLWHVMVIFMRYEKEKTDAKIDKNNLWSFLYIAYKISRQ